MASPPDRKNATPEHMLGHVLRPEELLTRASYRFAPPAAELLPWVHRYWSVEWEFAPGERFHTATLDDPATHLTVERGSVSRRGADTEGVWFTGPGSAGKFDVTLMLTGSVVGVRFHPGAWFAFASERATAEADTTYPASTRFSDTASLMDLPHNAVDAAPALDTWLLQHRPRDTTELQQLRTVLATLDEHPLDSLDSIAERSGCSLRTVQRLLRKLVGISPKRIQTRARVLRAAAELDSGSALSMAELAASLGWYDQAHFVHDFKSVTGVTPAAYLKRAQ